MGATIRVAFGASLFNRFSRPFPLLLLTVRRDWKTLPGRRSGLWFELSSESPSISTSLSPCPAIAGKSILL